MTATATAAWPDTNRRYLSAAVGYLRAVVQAHTVGGDEPREGNGPDAAGAEAMRAIAAEMDAPPALEAIRAIFHLSPFERDVVLLCAAMEFDATVASLCAAAQGDPQRTYPTFSLALAALPNAHWSALAPDAPLRRWQLIEVGAGPSLTFSPLRVDERVLHYIAGIRHLDARLAALIAPLPAAGALVPSHRAVVERLVMAWRHAPAHAPLPVVQLCGRDMVSASAIAAAACADLGLQVHAVSADLLPTAPADLHAVIRVWEREALLGASALLLDCEELDGSDSARIGAIRRFIEQLGQPLIVACRDRQRIGQRPSVTLDVAAPDMDEQGAVWHAALGETAQHVNGHVDHLVAQFNLSAAEIVSAAAVARGGGEKAATDQISDALWEACRLQSRARLDDLAQRIVSPATWEDLVLPEAQRSILPEIAVHVRQRSRVYQQWGFASKGERGLGISALFAGASGTGKTMAAEVLANELRLDLYRIDLSAVVSKYIGETEKNLRRLFDAAEAGGAILLFDEADALFGKRSEVKDSHDRYANIEVGYLLQRMESYRGLAILTTNFKSALDTAFLRRIRFVVQFPFPDAAQRAEIWRRVFPSATPTEGLNIEALARLNVAGGNIRNIALNAAFLAAEADEPVRHKHLLSAARAEYAKLEKPLTHMEIGGWE